MKPDKSYELIPGIRVTDAENYLDLTDRLDTSKYPQLDRKNNKISMYYSAVLDRLAKFYPVTICKMWIDVKRSMFCYENLKNADETELLEVPFEKAAKQMGWPAISYDSKTMYFSKEK